MSGLISATFVFLLLCASAALGMFIRPRLKDLHRNSDTAQVMAVITGMLVTLSALVLGLLTASVKAGYDSAGHNRQEYALQLTQLDNCLRDYGAEGDTTRADIRRYTAAVIASTWPSETVSVGVTYPDTSAMPRVGANPVLADLMHRIGTEVSQLAHGEHADSKTADSCQDTYRDVLRARLAVIEDVQGKFSMPFYRIFTFWLMIVFANFGLMTPRHSLSIVSIGLCALSLSTAIFVIVDLSQPYTGFFGIPSASMRTALASMSR